MEKIHYVTWQMLKFWFFFYIPMIWDKLSLLPNQSCQHDSTCSLSFFCPKALASAQSDYTKYNLDRRAPNQTVLQTLA